MIIATVLAAALVAALVPAAPAASAPGPRLFRNYSTGLCLTYGTSIATGKTIAATGSCDPSSQRTLWKRTGRSQLASGSMCVSQPTGRQEARRVLVRRCASGLKAQRLSFTVVSSAMDGEHVQVRWKGAAPGMCLASNAKGEVYPDHCRPKDGDTEWVIVRWSTD